MALAKIARDAGNLAAIRATWGGSQNFLGAAWVEQLVDRAPQQARRQVALRLLALSPHYFYDRDIRAEDARNRRSRVALADALIAPQCGRSDRVLDYGCGPGYLARAIAGSVARVTAVDISRGVLACARAINGAPNISYLRPDQLSPQPGQIDLAYSFAVIQHLAQPALEAMLAVLANQVREDGQVILHFVVPDGRGWRSEGDWRQSQSLANRAKLHYGLNCFARTPEEMTDLASSAGFTDVIIRPLSGEITIPGDDDIPSQHLLTARRK